MNKLSFLLALILTCNLNAQNFTPSTYSPALWLDASDTTSVIHSSRTVSAWNDLSGNGNHVTQTTAINRPNYLNTTQGIAFDGIDDLLMGNNLGYGVADTTITLFIVASPNPGSAKGSVIAKGQWTSGSDYRIELGENGYDVAIQNAREWNSSSGNWNIAHKNMFRTYYTDDSVVGYYLNGAREELPRFNVTYNHNNDPFSIGARFNYSDFFNGQIFEVLLFQSELSLCEMEEIEGYLAHKWGLQAYVISNHPYKNNNFGLCSEQEQYIDENSPNGTVVGTLTGNYVNTPITFSNWRIEDGGLYTNMFALDSTGDLTVNDNAFLDYELASAFNIEVSALANGIRVYGGVRINVNDLADGGVQKIHSELWGLNGEKWDSRGRLPDFSYVGYKSGEKNYHYVNTTVDVTTFGAITTDSLSDVSAINAAIASIDSGIIYFPAGLYVLDTFITVQKNNIVLRGAGNDSISGTRFYFPFNAVELGTSSSSANTGGDGYIITFEGTNSGPAYNIVEETRMGDRSLTLDNVSGLNVGDYVNIEYTGTHPFNGELRDHILNNQNHEWACSVGWSNGNGGLIMYHIIERIDGNIVTLREPIRLDIKNNWNARLRKRSGWYVENCGVENIFMEHKSIPQPSHGNAPGSNSASFVRTFNCWIENVSIKNSDNALNHQASGYGEVKNISFYGREGHHGWKFAYSSHCLADSIYFKSSGAWIHSFTLTHKANGNVVSNIFGEAGIPISSDFHRNTPWETLITNVDNDWNYNSGGVWCTGPNAGKRTVYWNMGGNGITSYPIWDDYQTTLVGDLSIPEQFHNEKGWHEHVPNVQPSNLYYSQLNRRLTLPTDPPFTTDPDLGDRENYWERDPSRWRIKDGAYQLFFSETPILTGNRLGEYTVYYTVIANSMVITSNVASLENTIINSSANAALIVNYQDDLNYYHALFSANPSVSGIYKVVNGASSLLKPVATILTNNYSTFSFKNNSGVLAVYENGVLIDSISDNTFTNGRVGFGTLNDACSFDEIELKLPTTIGIENFASINNNLKLYPNPTKNKIFLKSDKKELSQIKIFDLLGKDLTQKALISVLGTDKVSIDLYNFIQGIYIIKTKTIANKVYKK